MAASSPLVGSIDSQRLGVVRLISLILVLALPFSLLLAGLFVQGPEVDEATSLLMVSGHTGPTWPSGPSPALLVLFLVWRDDEGAAPGPLVAALMVALTLPATYYAATTARGYALGSLLLILAFLGVIRISSWPPRGRDSDPPFIFLTSAMVGLLASLAVLTHYLAAFAVAVLGCRALARLFRGRDWWSMVVMLVCGAAPVAIAGYFILFQLGSRPHQFVGFPGFLELATLLLVKTLMAVPGEGPPDTSLVFLRLILFFSPVLVLLLAGGLIHRWWRDPDRFPVLALALQVVVSQLVGLMVLAYLSGKTLHEPRYLAIIWPFMALTLAKGALWFTRSPSFGRLGWAVPLLLVGFQSSLVLLAVTDSPGQSWRRIAQAAESSARPSLLMVDKGWGRAAPGAVALSTDPETWVWVVSPEQLAEASTEGLLAPYGELHVALSWKPETRDQIQTWLSGLESRFSFVEQESSLADHRHFSRRAQGCTVLSVI